VILPHIHTGCCGRLLRRVASDGAAVVRCADCGEEIVGQYEEMCWCGVAPVAARTKFKCIPNPHRTPETPAEIAAAEVAP
jgi:hypothetical protein